MDTTVTYVPPDVYRAQPRQPPPVDDPYWIPGTFTKAKKK